MSTFAWIITGGLAMSAIALVGSVTLVLTESVLQRIILPLVAFAALRTGRPVRLVLSLEQTFQAVRRAACEVHVRTGFRPDGTLVFQDVAADYLIGAYADIADRVVGKGSYPACGPYNVPATT